MNLKRYDTDETAVPYESFYGVWVDHDDAKKLQLAIIDVLTNGCDERTVQRMKDALSETQGSL